MQPSFNRHSLSSSSKQSWPHSPAHRLRRTNRVRSGDIAIQVAGAKAAAVLGNAAWRHPGKRCVGGRPQHQSRSSTNSNPTTRRICAAGRALVAPRDRDGRPGTFVQDRSASSTNPLATHGRTIHWVNSAAWPMFNLRRLYPRSPLSWRKSPHSPSRQKRP
jgi:hypothetical protein